jgi:hypothetical protein
MNSKNPGNCAKETQESCKSSGNSENMKEDFAVGWEETCE